MGKSLITGAIVGGIILFVWMMISWMALPWHKNAVYHFDNEEAVSTAVLANAPQDGIYFLPDYIPEHDEEPEEQMKSLTNEGQKDVMTGPIVFASIRRHGMPLSMTGRLFVSLIVAVVSAGIVSSVIRPMRARGYFFKVGAVTLIGFLIGFAAYVPHWNWWGFPFSFVAMDICDLVIGWFLAGLALAAINRHTHSSSKA